MRILLDESVPQKLRVLIGSGHRVFTTWFQRWSGLQNGELLAVAEATGFEVFVTADQQLRYQQNLAARKIAIVVLSTNNWSIIQQRIATITAAIDDAVPGGFFFVDIGN